MPGNEIGRSRYRADGRRQRVTRKRWAESIQHVVAGVRDPYRANGLIGERIHSHRVRKGSGANSHHGYARRAKLEKQTASFIENLGNVAR